MERNPFAPPAANVSDVIAAEAAPPLWSPNAAANWCLIFTPIFGSYLHMRNWRALGQDERAAASKRWFVACCLINGTTIALIGLPGTQSIYGVFRLLSFLLLISWYFASARGQAKYVKEHFGKDYPRKSWGPPLGFGLLAWILAYFLIFMLIAMRH
jgi:hypothetical protein